MTDTPRPEVITQLLAADDTGVVANYIRRLEAQLTASQGQVAALRALAEKWTNTARIGRTSTVDYSRGRRIALAECADELLAALASLDPEPAGRSQA
jgi:hypothetical protein